MEKPQSKIIDVQIEKLECFILFRYAPWMEARLRAKTDLPGLYLTGQDVLDSGVVSAASSGVLTAQVHPVNLGFYLRKKVH